MSNCGLCSAGFPLELSKHGVLVHVPTQALGMIPATPCDDPHPEYGACDSFGPGGTCSQCTGDCGEWSSRCVKSGMHVHGCLCKSRIEKPGGGSYETRPDPRDEALRRIAAMPHSDDCICHEATNYPRPWECICHVAVAADVLGVPWDKGD